MYIKFHPQVENKHGDAWYAHNKIKTYRVSIYVTRNTQSSITSELERSPDGEDDQQTRCFWHLDRMFWKTPLGEAFQQARCFVNLDRVAWMEDHSSKTGAPARQKILCLVAIGTNAPSCSKGTTSSSLEVQESIRLLTPWNPAAQANRPKGVEQNTSAAKPCAS